MSGLQERGAGDGQEADSVKSTGESKVDYSGRDNSSSVSPATATEGVEPDLLGATGGAPDIPPTRDPTIILPWDPNSQESKKTPDNWTPDKEILDQLTAMGINKEAAVKALFQTKNNSVELAISWLFENPESELANISDKPSNRTAISDDDDPSSLFKMVFVVNYSLGMKLGKTCAQVAHATLGIHHIMLQNQRTLGDDMVTWLEYGQAKIVLKGEDTQHLMDLKKKALDMNMPCYLVQDAGRTQIPAGSYTVLAIFGRIDAVDQITGSLKLL